MCDAVLTRVAGPLAALEPTHDDALRIALVGRPNVGKSTLLNRLIGKERAIVDATPGTTRDPLDTVVDWNGQKVVLVDTAGIRRKGKTERGIETLAVVKALKATDRAQIGVVVFDAEEGVTAQDAHIAGYVIRMGRGLVMACNKTDLIGARKNIEAEAEHLRERFPFLVEDPESGIAFLDVLDNDAYGDVIVDFGKVVASSRSFFRLTVEKFNSSKASDAWPR